MARNWAIAIGMNQYDFLPDPLLFAVSDAVAMQRFLCEQAGFPAEQVLLCGDGSETRLSSWLGLGAISRNSQTSGFFWGLGRSR
jgi:hypothetical protein